jgi:hypothetical protein
MPDMVYDPEGTAGDTASKPFTLDSGGSATGFQSHSLEVPHDGNSDDGYDELVVTFDDFQPGETMTFSIDVDPSSIKGVDDPGPTESGSVSGLEMVGSNVTVQFADGTASAPLYSDGSPSGGIATVRAGTPAAPGLTADGVALSSTTLSPAHVAGNVSTASQTMVVSGEPGATVSLLRIEGGQYLDGVPNGGFDVEAYEANTARSVEEYTATIEGDGDVAIPVTLTKTDAGAGYNYFVAVVEDSSGAGETSQVVVVKLE